MGDSGHHVVVQRETHPALLISEIIRKVMENYQLPADRPTLISLACTCKAFSDIALDFLWKEIRGVKLFSRLLFSSEDLAKGKAVQGSPQTEEPAIEAWRSRSERFQAFIAERERLIAQGVNAKSRDRVLSLARRVRRISMGPSDMNDPETYTFFAFLAAYPAPEDPAKAPRGPLPSLNHLQCTLTTIHGATHANHLLQLTSRLWNSESGEESQSSTLKSLEISAFIPWTYQTAAQTLVDERLVEISRAFRSLTKLEYLEFRCDQLSAATELAFAKALASLHSIKHASLGFKKYALGWAIVSLAGHKQLRECNVICSRYDVPGGLEPHPDGTFMELVGENDITSLADIDMYPVLETLNFTATTEVILDSMLAFQLPPDLLNIYLYCSVPTSNQLTQMILGVSANPTTLISCVISDIRLWMNKRSFTSAARPFTIVPLYPLLSLVHIQTVVIDIDVIYHLCDDDLGAFAAAWPALKKLHIAPWKDAISTEEHALPSFFGLKTLVEGSLALEELKLKINASRDPQGFTEYMQSIIGTPEYKGPASLKTWYIGASFIEQGDSHVIAEAIHTLLPNLRAFGLPHEITSSELKYKEWSAVATHLAALQDIHIPGRRRSP